MRRVERGILVVVALLLAPVAAHSEPAEGDSLRRWGFGWEAEIGDFYSSFASGLGVRYRATPQWGIGVIVNPFVRGSDSERRGTSTNSSGSMGTSRDSGDDEDQRLFAALMVYRESRVGRWLGIGPYAGIGYQHSSSEDTDFSLDESANGPDFETHTNMSRSESSGHEWSLSIGLRPTFTVEERFVLETRLGIDISFTHSEGESRSTGTFDPSSGEPEEDVDISRSESDSWDLTVLGQNLGPGATMTFIVYF